MKRVEKLLLLVLFISYSVGGYQLSVLCKYGGVKRHGSVLLLCVFVFVISIVVYIWSICKIKKDNGLKTSTKSIIKLLPFLLVTICVGCSVIHSAIPFNGKLSWELDEWIHHRSVELEHTNIYKTGVEGILEDLDKKLDLPEVLYTGTHFALKFDELGDVVGIDSYFYGEKKGETVSYYVYYDAEQSSKMQVRVTKDVERVYEESVLLDPMITMLQESDYMQRVGEWATTYESELYEILYYGERSFWSKEGLVYVEAPAYDSDIDESWMDFTALNRGGEMKGYEVSLYMPNEESVIPVRYMTNLQYTSAAALSQAAEEAFITEMDKSEESTWSVDSSDGSMYYFLDELIGWRLCVVDAAAGSRFYDMEQTMNGGTTWSQINRDPFGGEIGVTEGLWFLDKELGFAGLSGASQTYSQIYRTEDGGKTFNPIELLTDKDYHYCEMPVEEGDKLVIDVTADGGSVEGIRFESIDNGMTWNSVTE